MARACARRSVVVYLHSPHEKVFGVLLALQPAGVTVRGIGLAAFDHWLRQEARRDETVGGPEAFAERFPSRDGALRARGRRAQ